MIKGFTAFSLIFSVSLVARSQMSADLSLTTGSNQVSLGQYGKLGGQFSYFYRGWNFSAGAGAVFSAAREKKLDAVRLSVSKDYVIKDKNITTVAFYQFAPFSARLNDHAAGLLFNHKSRRWYYDLGLNTRFYAFTQKYKGKAGYGENVLWEPVNVIYRLTWHKPIGDKFEINPSVTNFDQFIIQQETNPFVLADFQYKLNVKSKIYFDVAYQQSGFFNIRVNYFGYYLRGGYKVNIGTIPENHIKLKPIEL
ncbi:MAG: hypothetical protein H3C48_01175 [Chitinophagaceae bacterium]|nr:hypothetical protein [Chitinophagaceae bacterium]